MNFLKDYFVEPLLYIPDEKSRNIMHKIHSLNLKVVFADTCRPKKERNKKENMLQLENFFLPVW